MLKAAQDNQGLVVLRIDNTNSSLEVRAELDGVLAPRLAAQKAHQVPT